jgi:hypothetical protein
MMRGKRVAACSGKELFWGLFWLTGNCYQMISGPLLPVSSTLIVVDVFIGKRYQRRPKQAAHQE